MQRIDFKSVKDLIQKTLAPVSALRRQSMLALLFFIIAAVSAHAQFGSSLSGTVLDSSGAVIPNATATLTNAATQQKFVSTTNETGAYHFSELGPGKYSLVVTAPGFKQSDLTDVTLEAESP